MLTNHKITLMDWYPGSGVDDLVVPKYQDFSDKLPLSPEIWSKWGTYASEGFVSPNNCYGSDMNMTKEEFNFNGFCNEVEIDVSVQDRDRYSGSSVCGGPLEESLQRTSLSCSQPDSELDQFARIEQLDDIFLSSLLEDLPSNGDIPELFDVVPPNNLLTNMTLDSKCYSSDRHSIGSSKYLQTHAFSPSADWDEGDVLASLFIPSNSEQRCSRPLKVVKPQVPSEENTASELVSEETSLEESVLQDLEIVMSQMTDKTRICFRDALYRLAESSKQHLIVLRQSGDFTAETPPGTGHDIHLRTGENKVMELETNIIDRTVANLMFNKVDFPGAEIKSKQEIISVNASQNDSSNQSHINHFCCESIVPTVS